MSAFIKNINTVKAPKYAAYFATYSHNIFPHHNKTNKKTMHFSNECATSIPTLFNENIYSSMRR